MERTAASELGRHSISNEYVSVDVDADSGTYSAWLGDGSPIVLNASSLATHREGSYSSSDRAFERTVGREPVSDAIGSGSRLSLKCKDLRSRCDMTVHLTVYEGLPGFVVETAVDNPGSEPLQLLWIEPCSTALADCAGLYPPDSTGQGHVQWGRVLTNGYLYSYPGRVQILDSNRPIDSCWNMAIMNRRSDDVLDSCYVSH